MSKYQKGKVYKLVSNSSELVYYGSTFNKLTKRLTGHKSDYKGYSNGKGQRYKTSYELIKLEDAQIILVEDFPCERKEQLIARERFYIENNPCVNKNIPSRTRKEYSKIYRENNIEKEKERHKKYRENNKEKERERGKIYYENINSKPITCDCGRDMARASLSRHLKSKIHFNKIINYLQL